MPKFCVDQTHFLQWHIQVQMTPTKTYHCARMDPSAREVQCISTYQCTASLPGQVTDTTKANVSVVLSKQGCPIYCTYQLPIMELSSILLHVDLKYHTNHSPVYCIFKAANRIYNLNIPYIALRVEINLALLS